MKLFSFHFTFLAHSIVRTHVYTYAHTPFISQWIIARCDLIYCLFKMIITTNMELILIIFPRTSHAEDERNNVACSIHWISLNVANSFDSFLFLFLLLFFSFFYVLLSTSCGTWMQFTIWSITYVKICGVDIKC